MSLVITDVAKQAMIDAMAFAIRNDCHENLLERLDYLATYAMDGHRTISPVGSALETRCLVSADHAPLSFTIIMERRDLTSIRNALDAGATDLDQAGWQPWFVGGLVYSGPGQPLDGSAPALTVSLSPSTGHSWSIHT